MQLQVAVLFFRSFTSYNYNYKNYCTLFYWYLQ